MLYLLSALRSPAHTLPEILERHYFPYARVRSGTVARYRCELKRWTRIVGDVSLSRISESDFHRFRSTCLARGLSPSSIEVSVKIVRILLRFARDRGWIQALPLSGKPLPLEEPEPEPATLDELSRLYAATVAAQWPGRGTVSPADWWRAFIVLEYWTGLRGQDMISRFAWTDVRRDHIRFRASKTGKRHTFPLCHVVLDHLRSVTGFHPDLVLGVNSLQRVNVELGRLCERAEIRRLTTGHIREACFTQWTLADETAGKLIHGCGIPRVLRRHYLGRLQILEAAVERFAWFEVG